MHIQFHGSIAGNMSGTSAKARSGCNGKAGLTLAAFTCVAAVTFGSAGVQAQSFPERPVQISVGQQAGGALDTIARSLATGLSQIWGQTVTILNRPGAAAIVSVQETTRAKPDGYTLVFATEGALTRSQFLVANLGYDPIKDLEPVSSMAVVPMVMVVNPDLMKAKDVSSFIAEVKKAPNKLSYASAGIGGSHHVLMARLEVAAGIQMTQVPYKGGAPALTDVMGGHLPVMFSGIATALPFIKSGRLVPLGFVGPQRSPFIPTVPTFHEQGFLSGVTGDWIAIMAPKGTPADITRKIATDIATVSKSETFQTRLLGAGYEISLTEGKDLADLIVKTSAQNKEIFRAAGIGVQ